jgi:phosphoglycerate dehydrogenase-like enzyme
MSSVPLTVWCNAHLTEPAMRELRDGIAPHRLMVPGDRTINLVVGRPDPLLAQADVAFGQPDPRQIIELPNLRWTHLTTAGYTRYDTEPVRTALRSCGAALTNSSSVYDEPCAEHVLSMMLALARRLPQSWVDQSTTRPWHAAEHRIHSRLLVGQTALILGFGAIARRLVQLLAPFRMNLIAVRRTVSGDEPIETHPFPRTGELARRADHVISLLPANASTEQFFDADLIGAMKPTAIFYNIGRGTTVDQYALRTALEVGRIAAAYLDVTDPEPLPPDDPLWLTPNCWITPHTAGGHEDEFERLVRHFLENLRRFTAGEPLLDRII